MTTAQFEATGPAPRAGTRLGARAALGLVGLGLTVMVLAWGAIEIPRDLGRAAPLWPANAVVLAALLTNPARRWPALLAAAMAGNLAANLLVGDAPFLAVLYVLCNAGEVLLGAALMRRLHGGEIDFSRARDLMVFCLASGLGAPLLSGAVAAFAMSLMRDDPISTTFLTWSAADGLGAMLIVPVLLTLKDARRHLKATPLTPAAMGSLVLLAAVSAIVFVVPQPLLFFIPAVLMLVVFQLEILGAVLGVAIIALAAIVASGFNYGPAAHFIAHDSERLFMAQIFLAVMLLTSLPTAAVLAQRRRLGAELAEQARRARLAEEIAGVGYYRLDTITGEVTWSDRMFELFGLPPGRPPTLEESLPIFHPDDRERIVQRYLGARERGEHDESESRLIMPDGSIRHVFGRSLGQCDTEGRPTGLVGTVIDITEVKMAQARAQEQEEQMRHLAENVSDVILKTSIDGQLLYISPAIEGLLGYKPEELIGKPNLILVCEEDREHVTNLVVECLRSKGTQTPATIEYRGKAKDGRLVWMESRPSTVKDPVTGRIAIITDVVRDVTERKLAQAELERAKAEAEAAAAVKGEFLANMSHELRTPLTSVLGFTRLALEQPELSAQSRDYIAKAARAGETLLTTVNDILDFSKLEAGQVEIRPRPTDPAAVCAETLELFSQAAADKGLTLAFKGGATLPAAVSLDPDRLRQLLLNLVGNAVKFSEKGEVALGVRWRARDSKLLVEVKDRGPGIAADQQARLFQRFSQVDASSTRRHGGTGLGLAICMGLAEAMGGSIGVSSVEGKGSRFFFEIAAPKAEAAVADLHAGEDPALTQGVRVLVADDHAVNRELVRAVLSPLGAIIVEAANGQEAVETAAGQPFDLIFMDLRMPVMDGVAAVRAIRAGGGPNADAPIIAFSAGSEALDEKIRQGAGFDAALVKPMVPADLLALAVRFTSFDPTASAAYQEETKGAA